MDTVEISRHQVLVFEQLRDGRWKTASEVARSAGVASRTARLHLSRMVGFGVLEQARVFPGHRFRLLTKPSQKATAFIERIAMASEAFGASP